MIAARIAAILGVVVGMTACATTPASRPAKLAVEPDAAQMIAIKTAVKAAMKREDLDMDPGRLVDTPSLIVRPKAVPGLTDRVPGTPTRMTLVTDGTMCWLQEDRGEMRIEMPEGISCR